jgi:hypothetical protein
VLLTISTTHRPATDLGFLLHKNPDRHHTAELGFGTLHVVYAEAGDERCTVALLADVDPVGLVRDRRGPAGNDFSLAQYVNDRPYAASSFLSVAIGKMFGTAMAGRSKERPELAETPIPLEARMPAVPCRGGETVLWRSSSRSVTRSPPSPSPSTPAFPAGATAATSRSPSPAGSL